MEQTLIFQSRIVRDDNDVYHFGYDIEVSDDDDFDIQDCEDYDERSEDDGT